MGIVVAVILLLTAALLLYIPDKVINLHYHGVEGYKLQVTSYKLLW